MYCLSRNKSCLDWAFRCGVLKTDGKYMGPALQRMMAFEGVVFEGSWDHLRQRMIEYALGMMHGKHTVGCRIQYFVVCDPIDSILEKLAPAIPESIRCWISKRLHSDWTHRPSAAAC